MGGWQEKRNKDQENDPIVGGCARRKKQGPTILWSQHILKPVSMGECAGLRPTALTPNENIETKSVLDKALGNT